MDINNFGPFNADTWGSVSDWTMVIVTALTAWYLYKTLTSQTIVQGLQQKLTDIEGLRVKYEIMPQFEMVNQMQHPPIFEDGYMSLFVIMKFTNTGKFEARNFKFKFTNKDRWEIANGEWKTDQFKILPGGYITIPVYDDVPGDYQEAIRSWSYTTRFTAEIRFEDIHENKYIQVINFQKGSTYDDLTITSPESI